MSLGEVLVIAALSELRPMQAPRGEKRVFAINLLKATPRNGGFHRETSACDGRCAVGPRRLGGSADHTRPSMTTVGAQIRVGRDSK